ncbi:MAG: protein kinase [Kofleriaceae bacterium]
MGTPSREAVVKTGDLVEGRYRIIRTLGEGGMGTVFLAEHTLIKRRVAIKILHPELATDADVIERFMNEARAAGTLGHPNIVESTDMGFTHNHVPYIVFEFLEGALLTDEIYRVGGLPVRRAVRIATQIASALHAAHNAGVIHRDLKSDNVFLTDKDDAFDHVKVLDFGISRFLQLDDRQKGMVMGTPEFMAPEQITDPESVDRRTDVYALGVILYEMLTARRPFASEDDPRALMQRIVRDAPPPLLRPEVPHALAETILGKMLAKQPDQRYQTMSDVEAALESFITRSDGTPVPSRRSATIPRPASSRTPLKHVMLPDAHARKSYVLYGIAALGLAVGALGVAFGLRGKHEDIAKTTAPEPQSPKPAAAMPAPRERQKIVVQMSADEPNAHVTFRRQVKTAPIALQLNVSDVVEIVEISAPGYKTARYWVTFDRPTHLRAHLVKGSGILEATEEDTLVALGEVHAETVAVVTPKVPAKVVEKPAPKPVPRKIGKAAVKPQVVAVPEPPPAEEVKPDAPVEEVKVEPAPAPDPVKTESEALRPTR